MLITESCTEAITTGSIILDIEGATAKNRSALYVKAFVFLSENKSKNELIYPSPSQLRDIMNPKF